MVIMLYHPVFLLLLRSLLVVSQPMLPDAILPDIASEVEMTGNDDENLYDKRQAIASGGADYSAAGKTAFDSATAKGFSADSGSGFQAAGTAGYGSNIGEEYDTASSAQSAASGASGAAGGYDYGSASNVDLQNQFEKDKSSGQSYSGSSYGGNAPQSVTSSSLSAADKAAYLEKGFSKNRGGSAFGTSAGFQGSGSSSFGGGYGDKYNKVTSSSTGDTFYTPGSSKKLYYSAPSQEYASGYSYAPTVLDSSSSRSYGSAGKYGAGSFYGRDNGYGIGTGYGAGSGYGSGTGYGTANNYGNSYGRGLGYGSSTTYGSGVGTGYNKNFGGSGSAYSKLLGINSGYGKAGAGYGAGYNSGYANGIGYKSFIRGTPDIGFGSRYGSSLGKYIGPSPYYGSSFSSSSYDKSSESGSSSGTKSGSIYGSGSAKGGRYGSKSVSALNKAQEAKQRSGFGFGKGSSGGYSGGKGSGYDYDNNRGYGSGFGYGNSYGSGTSYGNGVSQLPAYGKYLNYGARIARNFGTGYGEDTGYENNKNGKGYGSVGKIGYRTFFPFNVHPQFLAGTSELIKPLVLQLLVGLFANALGMKNYDSASMLNGIGNNKQSSLGTNFDQMGNIGSNGKSDISNGYGGGNDVGNRIGYRSGTGYGSGIGYESGYGVNNAKKLYSKESGGGYSFYKPASPEVSFGSWRGPTYGITKDDVLKSKDYDATGQLAVQSLYDSSGDYDGYGQSEYGNYNKYNAAGSIDKLLKKGYGIKKNDLNKYILDYGGGDYGDLSPSSYGIGSGYGVGSDGGYGAGYAL